MIYKHVIIEPTRPPNFKVGDKVVIDYLPKSPIYTVIDSPIWGSLTSMYVYKIESHKSLMIIIEPKLIRVVE